MDAIRFASMTLPDLAAKKAGVGEKPEASFADLLKQGIERVGELQQDANEQARLLIAGEPVELHRVILAGEQAGLAFELAMGIRNKAVEAYQEMMRMQV